MIRKSYLGALVLVGFVLGLVVSGRLVIRAQERPGSAVKEKASDARIEPGEARENGRNARVDEALGPQAAAGASVEEVLRKPFHFDFDRPTSLAEVCVRLKRSLGILVVLDVAALERQEVEPGDTVQLELEGVRLKTGLKLLLDQVNLTYHIVPDDNLLIITDRQGSDDPIDRIWSELRTLHRDLHDVQDAVDALTDSLTVEEEGPRMRKPTIVEERPDGVPPDEDPIRGPEMKARKPDQPPASTPKVAPERDPAPARTPGQRSMPGRVPLSNSRRAL